MEVDIKVVEKCHCLTSLSKSFKDTSGNGIGDLEELIQN